MDKFSNKREKIDKKAETIPCHIYDFSYEENHEQETGKPKLIVHKIQ